MANNNTLHLGSAATSGSFISNNSIYFSDLSEAINFEVPDFIASASIEIHSVDKILTSDLPRPVDSFSTSNFNHATYDYGIRHQSPGLGSRTGQFYVTHDDGSVTFTDTSTRTLGSDTSEPILSASLSGNVISVSIENGNGYIFKALAKKL